MTQDRKQKTDVGRKTPPPVEKGDKTQASSSRATDSEFVALLKRAEKGDESAMPLIREAMKDSPGMWDKIGDLAKNAQASWLKLIGGDDLVAREGIERRLSSLRRELHGPDPSPLERLLVERIVACWLQLQYADTIYVQNMKDMSIAWSEHHQRRQDRAHRRYLSAIRTLASVRKLALPVLQVNIGDKQVNIAGGNPTQASPPSPPVVGANEAADTPAKDDGRREAEAQTKDTAGGAQKALPPGD